MIQVLICEDEKLIAERLARFVDKALSLPARIEKVHSILQAKEYLQKQSIDLLFLDLNLHGKDGFTLLRDFLSQSFQTIVVSACTDRAIEAFEYGALDFIGKPFTQERIQKAVDRYERGLNHQERQLKYLAVKSRRETALVDIKTIKFIKAASIYSDLHLSSGEVKVYDKPLNQLLKLLPSHFQRVHKSYIVNSHFVQSIYNEKQNSYALVLSSGESIPLSRDKRKDMLSFLTRS